MDHSTPETCTCGHGRNSHRHGAFRCLAIYPPCSCHGYEERPAAERFTLGTLATYPNGAPPDGELSAAILDEKTGEVYPFGRWDNAKYAIAMMRDNPDDHGYFAAIAPRDGFTPAEPGVDEGRAS